jgi:hypothetical protein
MNGGEIVRTVTLWGASGKGDGASIPIDFGIMVCYPVMSYENVGIAEVYDNEMSHVRMSVNV